MILDLGCGGNLHEGAVGVDIVGRPATAADIVCNLGFERIPVEDNSVDTIIIHHFIEHIPGEVWYQESGKWQRHLPLVYLFNDIYRVLRHMGIIQVRVPIYPHIQSFQDPTHVPPFWTIETPYYFSGDYFSFRNVYGHTSRYYLRKKELGGAGGWWLDFELVAIKNLPEDFPFLLKYEGVE